MESGRKPLKVIQNVVVLAVLGLTVALVYQFARWFSVDGRIQDNTERVDNHEKKIAAVEEKGLERDETLLAHRQTIEDHQKKLEEHERKLVEMRKDLAEMESQVAELEQDATKNEGELRAVREELKSFREEYTRRLADREKLRLELLSLQQREAEHEARLQRIESLLNIDDSTKPLPPKP